MSEYPPGTFDFVDRIVEMNIGRIHHDRKANRQGRHRAARQPRSQAWLREVLTRLGHELVTWGEGLEERFGSGSTACGPRPADPPAV